MSDPTQGRTSVSFEEIERQATQDAQEQKTLDLNEIKVDGADIPEHLRGKSVKEIVATLEGREQALRLSELARTQAEGRPLAIEKPPEPEPVKEPTDEEIRAAYEEDPLQGMALMNERAQIRAERNLEARLGPLVNSTASQVESAARAKYADEFALFGEEITKIAATIPNAKAVLSNPAAWDDLVSLVRGRPNNFDKLMQHKMRQNGAPTRESVQQQEVQSIGFTERSGARSAAPTTVGQLDPIQKEIAEKMNMTPDEYIKWSKIS